MSKPVEMTVFSDVLCVWAYVAQARENELRDQFADQLKITHRFINLFGDTERRLGQGWKDKGGYDGFAKHVAHVCEDFPQVKLNPDCWTRIRPLSSANAHLVLKAVGYLEKQGQAEVGTLDQLAWNIRLAFFESARDVGDLKVVKQLAVDMGIDAALLQQAIDQGSAMAGLCEDAGLQQKLSVEGSPTYYMNQGRQKLFGNVGYRIIEANIQELLVKPEGDWASWC